MTTFNKLYALQFAYETKGLEENFQTLKTLISQCENNSIILAPELCLSGYNYQHLEESALFSQQIIPKLETLSVEKMIVLTLIEKVQDSFYNNLKVFYKGKTIHSRAKVKLFPLGDEQKYFKAASEEKIEIIDIEGIKLAFLVCFELRFSELWKRIQGADVILIPAYWGKLRKNHFETLSKALAIANQAYVLVANSSDESMCSSSGIIEPFGEETRDDNAQIISATLNLNQIKKMRKYINIGL